MQSPLSNLSGPEQHQFLRVAHEATSVGSHFDLFLWLQGAFQTFLPHQVLVCLVGDFVGGRLGYDIISALPGLRTAHCLSCEHVPVSRELFERWQMGDRQMLAFDSPRSELVNPACVCEAGRTLMTMGAALVHGLRDERSGEDALYLFWRPGPGFHEGERAMLGMLLPQIDFACRRVVSLGGTEANSGYLPDTESCMGVSGRELQVLEWVKAGKTNGEIGNILDISPYTVKNHLQRIFRKMDVMNRAQAVAKLDGFGRRR